MIHSGQCAEASGARSGADATSVMIAVALGLVAVWSMIALRVLSSALSRDTAERLAHAASVVEGLRKRTADDLRLASRVTAGDPRVAAALATGAPPGAAAAIADELARRRGAGVVVLAAPDGRVIAEAGADELRGLELIETHPLDLAQDAGDAIAAGWVIGDRIVDVGVAPVRADQAVSGYLVIGQELDRATIQSVADRTGVAIASAVDDTITLAAPGDVPRSVFAGAAGRDEPIAGQRIELHGDSYVVTVFELEGPGALHPRLILARSLVQAGAPFTALRSMIYAPALLVLVAALFAMTARRRTVADAAGAARARPA
jgi:hypothetical protein